MKEDKIYGNLFFWTNLGGFFLEHFGGNVIFDFLLPSTVKCLEKSTKMSNIFFNEFTNRKLKNSQKILEL